MNDITEQREAIAEALTAALEDVTVTARPVTDNVRPGDGWVNVTRVVPADFSVCAATFQVCVILSPDPIRADRRFSELAVPVVDAITDLGGVADVVLEPLALVTTGTVPGTLYALQITFTMEVE